MPTCFDVFYECARAIHDGELIEKVSEKDKEFHFQNWFQKRLENLNLNYDLNGRNSYPDFRLVSVPEGYEIKGLAWPGREKSYDANSQMPTGIHNGRTIFYVFGRYPKDLSKYGEGGVKKYPVIDLVICHGDFLNADHNYVHKNKAIRGFGSYGDILIRDRKMYVAPTPFALTEGTTGLCTLIVPEEYEADDRFKKVGTLERRETQKSVCGYSFDLEKNEMSTEWIDNVRSNELHRFNAFRLRGASDKIVSLSVTGLNPESIIEDTCDEE